MWLCLLVHVCVCCLVVCVFVCVCDTLLLSLLVCDCLRLTYVRETFSETRFVCVFVYVFGHPLKTRRTAKSVSVQNRCVLTKKTR